MKQRRWRRGALLISLLFMGGNGAAVFHARSMTHFVDGGPKTGRPESLSLFEKLKVVAFGVRIPKPKAKTSPQKLNLRFEVHRVKSTDEQILDAWFLPAESGRAVAVVFHGYGGEKSRMLDEAQAFLDLGTDVFVVDFRGFGESTGSSTTIGYDEADDVASAVDYVRSLRPGKKILLYGESMGACAVLRAVAYRGVAPDGIVLVGVYGRMLDTVVNRFKLMGVPSFPAAHFLVFWGGAINGFNAFSHNPEDYSKQVSLPTLVLHGAKDERVSEESARAVFEGLSGKKRFVLLKNSGHGKPFGHDRAAWLKEVRELLERLG